MYTLSNDEKLAVISALLEGNSIRSINRMTDIDRNTIGGWPTSPARIRNLEGGAPRLAFRDVGRSTASSVVQVSSRRRRSKLHRHSSALERGEVHAVTDHIPQW
jgi:hypothetical protein